MRRIVARCDYNNGQPKLWLNPNRVQVKKPSFFTISKKIEEKPRNPWAKHDNH